VIRARAFRRQQQEYQIDRRIVGGAEIDGMIEARASGS